MVYLKSVCMRSIFRIPCRYSVTLLRLTPSTVLSKLNFSCILYFFSRHAITDIKHTEPMKFSFSYSQQILTDLVQGEFMQLGAKETENERFAHYLTKTFRKTASLIANSLKSVNILKEIKNDSDR